MAESTPSALTMLTTFFSTDAIETAARQTGFVKRTSKITGKLFLALRTCGLWSNAKTTLAQLAAKAAHILEPLEVSPEALHQRMHKPAIAFLQEMIRQAFAHMRTLDPRRDDGLFAACTIADSTGFGLPDTLKETFPGAGGSATLAGAKMQLVWDYRRGCFEHCALTPWTLQAIQLGQPRVPGETQTRHQGTQVHRRRALPQQTAFSLPLVMPLGMITSGGKRVLHQNLELGKTILSMLAYNIVSHTTRSLYLL